MADPGRTEGGRVALVTGGGSGIGRVVARALLAGGYRVAVAGRRELPLVETVDGHADGLVVPMDVADADSVRRGFDKVVARWGRLDLLFNNAGTSGPAGAVNELSPADWDACVAVNLTGTMLCSAAAVTIMKAQDPQGGRIINNGSISAHTPRPRSVAYTATKHAVSGLTKAIELDGRAYGISCGQIDIGNAATEMTSGFGGGTPQADGSLLKEPTFPAEEVARAVLMMADLPASATVNSLVITAAGMPYIGRG